MDEQTKPAQKKIYKRWWFWIIAVIVFLGVVGALSDKKDASTKIGSVVESTNSKPQPEPSTFKIGDLVQRGDTVLTVKEVNKDWKSSNQFDKPQSPNNVYVIVGVGIANNGSKDMSLSGTWDFKLTDGQGGIHTQSLGGIGLNKLGSGSANSLAPGGLIAGYLIFEVPKSATEKMTLRYQPAFTSGAPAEIQLQ